MAIINSSLPFGLHVSLWASKLGTVIIRWQMHHAGMDGQNKIYWILQKKATHELSSQSLNVLKTTSYIIFWNLLWWTHYIKHTSEQSFTDKISDSYCQIHHGMFGSEVLLWEGLYKIHARHWSHGEIQGKIMRFRVSRSLRTLVIFKCKCLME